MHKTLNVRGTTGFQADVSVAQRFQLLFGCIESTKQRPHRRTHLEVRDHPLEIQSTCGGIIVRVKQRVDTRVSHDGKVISPRWLGHKDLLLALGKLKEAILQAYHKDACSVGRVSWKMGTCFVLASLARSGCKWVRWRNQ